MKNFHNYLTVKKAAELLGISPTTLRNWDTRAKLRAYRHPVNGYRLYLKSDLEELLHNIKGITS